MSEGRLVGRHRLAGVVLLLAVLTLVYNKCGPAGPFTASRDCGDTCSDPSETAIGGPAGSLPEEVLRGIVVSPVVVGQSWNGVLVIEKREFRGDYRRADYGETWTDDNTAQWGHNSCDTRNDILRRDLEEVTLGTSSSCPTQTVLTGVLHSPYTGSTVMFQRGPDTSGLVQIDHVIALATAHDLGAWSWPAEKRIAFANDPLELLAVDEASNQAKKSKLPDQWMPTDPTYHCAYARRIVVIAQTYSLPLPAASAKAMNDALATCP